ncbi:MAG: Crp/Fnr family transcriptional regulator, partial [Geminicoccaceae bacterium]
MTHTEPACRYRPIRLKGGTHGLCEHCGVRQYAVCGALDPRCAARLESLISTLHLTSKQILFIEGEPSTHRYTIVKGVVSIAKSMADGRRQIVGFLFPGDFVGMGDSVGYSCTAQAVTQVELCRFSRSSFEALTEDFPEIEHRLLHAVSTELIEAQEHMLILGRKTAEERLCSFLRHLSARAIQRGEPDNPVALPMSRADIGDYLGLSLETVSRTFTLLRDQGLIHLVNAHTAELLDR